MSFSHSKSSHPTRSDHKTPQKGLPPLSKPRVAAPPPSEEWDVDDEEAMASPLYSVTPHSTKCFDENMIMSPYAPAITRRPNEMKAALKSERYLSAKEMSGSGLSQSMSGKTKNAVTTTPSKRPQLRLNSAKSSTLLTERKAFKPKPVHPSPRASLQDVLSLHSILRNFLSFCGISSTCALLKVNSRLRTSRYVGKRLKELVIAGMEFDMRMRFWRAVTEKVRVGQPAGPNFRPATLCPKEIRDDIVRTPSFIAHQPLTTKQQTALMRILDAVSSCNHEVGYCQGMNYIGGFLVQVLPNEEESFWVMNSLLNDFKLKNLLKPGLSQLKLMCFQMDCLLQAYLLSVRSHLKSLGVSTEVYCAKWFVTLMCYELPYQLLMKVWDLFFLKGWKVFFRVILAMLSLSQRALMEADSGSISHVLKSLPRRMKEPETVLKVAFTYKITRRLLGQLETYYSRNYKGRYQIVVGKNHKLEWVVTPKVSESTEDSSIMSILMSKVWQIFGKDEASREDTQLDSTICMEDVQGDTEVRTGADFSLLSNEELKEALSIKDLDSGKVYYPDVPTPKSRCTVCGSPSHLSQFCTEDIDMTPRVLPALHLHPKSQETSVRLI